MNTEPNALVSSTAALTTTRDLKHVTGPENLPPSVAREVAEIVATYRPTSADFLRCDVPSLLGTTAFVFMLTYKTTPVWALLAFVAAAPIRWRRTPLIRAQQHLKDVGLNVVARSAVGAKLAAIVGIAPAQDPAHRPGVEDIVALLAPGGEDPWAPSLVTSRTAMVASTLDTTIARSIVRSALERSRRARVMWGLFGVFAMLMAGLYGQVSIVAFMGVCGVGSASLLWVLQRKMTKQHLSSLGLASAEQQRILGALKQVLATRADVPRQEQPEVLAQRLIAAIASGS